MTGNSDWPLPSQSSPVRMFLYLAEGMIVAAGATILLFYLVYPLLNTLFAVTDGNIFHIILLLPIIIFLFGRILLPVAVTDWDANWPLAYQDWGESRRWRKVAIVALGISPIHLGILALLWKWWSILSFEETFFLSVGLLLVGFLLHQYFFYRIKSTQ
jgi:hypothetical protein